MRSRGDWHLCTFVRVFSYGSCVVLCFIQKSRLIVFEKLNKFAFFNYWCISMYSFSEPVPHFRVYIVSLLIFFVNHQLWIYDELMRYIHLLTYSLNQFLLPHDEKVIVQRLWKRLAFSDEICVQESFPIYTKQYKYPLYTLAH